MPALLELRSVSKRFGQVVIADDLSVTVQDGDAVGIVGPNGAGKTTLFGLISGDVPADAGTVLLDGADLAGADPAERCRRGLGRTYQVPRPFEGMTVFENVLVAAQAGARLRGQASHERALTSLEQARLGGQANRRAGSLGLLERKRLEVARALATGPRVLLLDEVAGGLTDLEVQELVDIVRDARSAGMAVIWIEHVVRALVATVDRLLCLAGGHFVADGPPHEVLDSPAVREVYLGADTSITAGPT
ncbi:MAG TPA: ABC transporter ATP-binding protein [Acidimicrobiales bacterium]|nr:ABC transporter ATP-binding protein [Acidimicrobiales bacterium]